MDNKSDTAQQKSAHRPKKNENSDDKIKSSSGVLASLLATFAHCGSPWPDSDLAVASAWKWSYWYFREAKITSYNHYQFFLVFSSVEGQGTIYRENWLTKIGRLLKIARLWSNCKQILTCYLSLSCGGKAMEWVSKWNHIMPAKILDSNQGKFLRSTQRMWP